MESHIHENTLSLVAGNSFWWFRSINMQILDPEAPKPSFYGGLATEADHRVPLEPEADKDDHEHDSKRQPDDFSTALAK